jgi:hypothetical protein
MVGDSGAGEANRERPARAPTRSVGRGCIEFGTHAVSRHRPARRDSRVQDAGLNFQPPNSEAITIQSHGRETRAMYRTIVAEAASDIYFKS